MSPAQSPPVVAELGRPETPDETAARKAESSRNHRSHQTVNNLVLSLLATLAIAAIIVLMGPHSTSTAPKPVDYHAVAASARGVEPDPLINPELPKTWHANSAELSTSASGGVDNWYIGLITPNNQYIGIRQGFKANPTWVADQVKNSASTRSATIDGIDWKVYDNRNTDRDMGDVEYAMSMTASHSTFVLYGTADNADFRTLAQAIARDLHTPGAS